MRLEFLNRENEKERLVKAITSQEGTFSCVYGRRRCGKSRLLNEVLKGRTAVYFSSDEREAALQRASLSASIASILPGFDQVVYPDWNSLFERWWKEAPKGAVLALDEFPYLAKVSSEIPSILQRIIDREKSRNIHLIVSGSSQRMMQGFVLDASAPLYGRAQQIIQVKPLGVAWIGKAFQLSQPEEYLEPYSLWGGVPRYWELAVDYQSSRQAIQELVLDPLGVLYDEPRRLLIDDLRETTQTISLLSLIGRGCNRISEIAARLGKPATSLTRPLARLLEMGFVRREQPFGASKKSSKKTLYKLDDPFMNFWFQYVEANRSRLESGQAKAVADDIYKNIRQHYGDVWEDLSRSSVARLKTENTEWLPAQRWWGAGIDKKQIEVDIVSRSVDGSALLVGEVRLQLDSKKLKRTEIELEKKVGRLVFSKNYRHIVKGIFVLRKGKLSASSARLISANDVFSVLK